MEAIILAGGFGKRLQKIVCDIPKPMATINDKPFLDYLLNYLINNKIEKVILSVFYKYNLIKNHYGSCFRSVDISYSIDAEALGTGGAIRNAISMVTGENVFVINGDTYFNVNLSSLLSNHEKNKNDITFSLKPMTKFDRYGYVDVNKNGRVLSLKEKQYCESGAIDGGIYIIKKSLFNIFKGDTRFAFNDFIRDNLTKIKVGSVMFNEKFIDIGTPDDFDKAHNVLVGL